MNMKKDFGKRILHLMAEAGIKSAKELADRINEAASEKLVTPTSVGRWLAGKSQPKSTSLMFLAKALKVSADLILFDDGDNPDKTKELTKMITVIVQAETKKLLSEGRAEVENTLALVLKSDKIPPEDKEALIRQARNLLKLYEKGGSE